ncbi:MAG TPA: TonB-dependent receptor [Bacteroidota bacterium]|nr:TonB-dependent receptor [Bacteroidota bacterium]
MMMRACFCCLCFLLLSPDASAQPPHGTAHTLICGRVTDAASGLPVEGSIIVIVGSTLGAVSDASGYFMLRTVSPGTYQLRASALGYAPRIIRDAAVSRGDSLFVSIQLDEHSIQVGEVVISGTMISDTIAADQSIRRLEYKEIHNTAGAFDDVVRTVSILPGMAQTRPEHNGLYVRGGSSTENLFFIDNVEIANINHFGSQGSTGGSMSFINFEFIDNFTFSNGGFGVQYGDKLSSVLTLGMRSGRPDKHRGKVTVSATMAGLNFEGPVTGSGSYLFSVRRSYLDPVFKFYGFGFIPYFWDFLAKASFQLNKSNTIEFLSVAALDRMAVNNATEQNRYDNERMIFSDQNFVVSGLTWRHGFDAGTFVLTARESYGDFDYDQTEHPVALHYFKNKSYENENSLRADLSFRLSEHGMLTAGAEAKHARLDSRMTAEVIATGFAQYEYTVPVDTSQRTTSYKADAYVQYSLTVGAFTATIGARGDFFSMIKHETVFAPRVSLAFAPTLRTKFTLSAGRYYQSPSYVWLMANPYNRGLNQLGMNQYVAGVEIFLQSDVRVSAEVYAKNYFDYPASYTRPYLVMINSGDDVTDLAEAYTIFGLDFLQSRGYGRSRGIDLLIEKRLSETPLYGRLSLSISKSLFTAIDGVERPSSNDQTVIFNAGGGYIMNEKWEFTGTFRFSTGRAYSPIASTSFFLRSVEQYNSARTDNNHRLDVRISRRWDTSPIHLSTYLDIQNLYNRPWRGVPFFSDRNQRMELPPSTGIVPSLGIIAEF